jgi:hypothetical protein
MSHRAGGPTAEQFVEKWSKAQLSERAASQEHFIDQKVLANLLRLNHLRAGGDPEAPVLAATPKRSRKK